MRRALAVLAACAFLAATTPVAAQATVEAQRPQQPPAKPVGLNLKLDDPARFARPPITSGPAAKEARSGLPSLGGDALRVEPPSRPRPEWGSSPYPKDTNPGH